MALPPRATHPTAETTSQAPDSPASPFRWRMIESEDFRQYLANLRAIGCPEKTIRDIIVAEVEQLYAARWAGARRVPPGKFWEGEGRRRLAEHEVLERLIGLQEEKLALIKELLGEYRDARGLKEWEDEELIGILLGFLPEGKPEQLATLLTHYQLRFELLEKQSGRADTPADQARKEALYERMMSELRQVLSAAELEEGELRLIAVAHAFEHHGEDAFEMTAAEFRELIRLTRDFNHPRLKAFSWTGEVPPEQAAAAQRQIDSRFRQFLGEQRFADYQRGQDADFREIYRFAQNLSLPRQAAVQVFETWKVAVNAAAQIRLQAEVSESEKTAMLDTLHAGTVQTVAATLGQAAYGNYLHGHGQWLTNLTVWGVQ